MANYINGAAFKPSDWSGIGIPIIRIQNLTDLEKPLNRTKREVASRLLIRNGDLLFSWSATLDAFVWHGEDAWLNQHIFKVEPDVRVVVPRFLYFLLRHSVRQIVSSEHMHGSTMQHINRGPFMAHSISLPPINEQQRIADALDELLSDLDAGVSALERARAKLRQYRASVLKAAVEGALTEDWRKQRPEAEPASELLKRILAERRRRWEEDQLRKFKDAGRTPPKDWKVKYKEPVAPDTTALPVLPEGWCWSSLGQSFEVHVGATPNRAIKDYWNGDIPWVASGEVQFCDISTTRERITQRGLDNTSTQINPAGSVILNMIGEGKTRGKAGILSIAACNNQNCAAIWVSQTPIEPKLIYFWLMFKYEKTRELGSGNNQPAMNSKIVGAIPFPLPPSSEQTVILDRAEEQLSVIDHLEADLAAKVGNAEALRQSILRHAFAGKLVPQDSRDEPASELLKRIAAEREQHQHRPKTKKRARGDTRAAGADAVEA